MYIEFKSRTCRSTPFETTCFGKSKVDRWSKNKHFSSAIIYMAFSFGAGTHYFIRYNEVVFNSLSNHELMNGIKPISIYH